MATTDTLLTGFLNPTTGKLDYDAITKAVQSAATNASIVAGPTSIANYLPSKERYIPTKPETQLRWNPLFADWANRGMYETPESQAANARYEEALNLRMKNVPFNGGGVSTLSGMSLADREANLMKGQGIVQSYATQREAMGTEAQKNADALRMAGAQTVTTLKNLGETADKVQSQYDAAIGGWTKAMNMAEGNATNAPQQVINSLNQLKAINDQIGVDRDFSKAHDAQATAMSVVNATRGAVKQAAELYGVDSPEYQAAVASKAQSLAAAQSSTIATYQKLSEDQHTAWMNASGTIISYGALNVEKAQEQAVETARYFAQSSQEYSLQVANWQLAKTQLEGTVMGDLVTRMEALGTPMMDVAPFLTALAGTLPPMS